MGTRSTTKIYDRNKLVLALYKQYDGDPDGWGADLKSFIKSGKWVNVMRLSEVKRKFPDTFVYKGKKFTMISYSMSSYKGRSNEVIWESEDGSQVYYLRGDIDYIPWQDLWAKPKNAPVPRKPAIRRP